MALIGKKIRHFFDRMMLDSGTTYHLTSCEDEKSGIESTNVPISLANGSDMVGTARGTRSVNCQTEGGSCKVKVTDTIVVLDLSMILI